MAKKEQNEKTFYFVDTREDAKNKKQFGIKSADNAKTFTREYNNGEGPFKPVDPKTEEFQVNRNDLKEADLNETENQIKATEHNMELLGVEESESVYSDMSKEELQEELQARSLDYKKTGKEATNSAYIKALMADDGK